MMNREKKKWLILGLSLFLLSGSVMAETVGQGAYVPGTSGISLPSLSLSFGQTDKPAETVNVLRIIMMLTVLTLAPAILIMMTSFTRIVVVLSF